MTVNTTNITSGPYEGNGVADTFSYTFRIEDKTQLTVYETDATGAQTTLVVDTHYTVDGIGNDGGGTVTRVAGALPTGYSWYIRSNYDETQKTDFDSQGGFFPDVHEKAIDKLTFLMQQLKDRLNRTLRVPLSEESGGITAIPAGDRQGKIVTFDADGNPTLNNPYDYFSGAEDDAAKTFRASSGLSQIGTLDLSAYEYAWFYYHDASGDKRKTLLYKSNSAAWAVGNKGTRFLDSAGNKWGRVYIGKINATWFDGVTGVEADDQTTGLQAAFDLADGGGTVCLPKGKYRYTKPLSLPKLASLEGDGNNSELIPDYGSWVGTDYRALIIKNKEGVNYNGREFNRTIKGFSIFGLNTSTVEAIALDFRAEDPTLITTSSVNNSVYNMHVEDLYIEKFDTAVNIYELWASDFKGLFLNKNRVGVNIEGQAVNLKFSQLEITNPTTANTSSTANTHNFRITQATRYGAGGTTTKRPEGIVCSDSLIYGAHNNLHILYGLSIKFSECIIDGGSTGAAVYVLNPADLAVTDCWLWTAADAIVEFGNLAAVQSQPIRFESNNLVAGTSTTKGFSFPTGGVLRENIHLNGNHCENIEKPFDLVNCPNYSSVKDNTASMPGSATSANRMIYVQNGGKGTEIDGNKTSDAVSIIELHPTATDPGLIIGENVSGYNKTKKKGRVTIPAGNTVVAIDSELGKAEKYMRIIVTGIPTQDTRLYYTERTSWQDGQFKIPAALASDLVILYETTTIPATAY